MFHSNLMMFPLDRKISNSYLNVESTELRMKPTKTKLLPFLTFSDTAKTEGGVETRSYLTEQPLFFLLCKSTWPALPGGENLREANHQR